MTTEQARFVASFESKVRQWEERIEALAIEMMDDRTPQDIMYSVNVFPLLNGFTAVVTSMREAHERNAKNPQVWLRPGPKEDAG